MTSQGVSTVSAQAADYAGNTTCLLYTSDAADERSSVDLGGRRIIKKKQRRDEERGGDTTHTTLKAGAR